MADTEIIEVVPHKGLQDLVRNGIGAAVDKLLLHLCICHHGCRKSNTVDSLLKLQRVLYPDGADHVEDLCLRLYHVRRISTGIRDGVMDPCAVRHMLS